MLGVVFVVYGVILSLSFIFFVVLLVDVFDEDNCFKLVGIVWFMLMVGIVVGVIVSFWLLNIFEICGLVLLNVDVLLVKKIVDIV